MDFTTDQWNLFLQNNDIEMYSTLDKGKSVVAERFIRTFKSKIDKDMTSVGKNVYIDRIDDTTINTTIKIIEQLKWKMLM